MENGRGLTEKEQDHRAQSQQGEHDGNTHKNGCSLEGAARYRTEVIQPPNARLTRLLRLADGPETEPAGIIRLHIPYPLRGDERHNTDDRVAYREYRPQNTDPLRVTHVRRRVDVRRFDVFDFRAHFPCLSPFLALFTAFKHLPFANGRRGMKQGVNCAGSSAVVRFRTDRGHQIKTDDLKKMLLIDNYYY